MPPTAGFKCRKHLPPSLSSRPDPSSSPLIPLPPVPCVGLSFVPLPRRFTLPPNFLPLIPAAFLSLATSAVSAFSHRTLSFSRFVFPLLSPLPPYSTCFFLHRATSLTSCSLLHPPAYSSLRVSVPPKPNIVNSRLAMNFDRVRRTTLRLRDDYRLNPANLCWVDFSLQFFK